MSTHKILVVDDQALNREVLERFLSRQGHYVVLAEGGPQALERLETEAFSLVLLDIMMPEMDGFEVLTRIRKKFSMQVLPVMMISARTETEAVVQALKLGANDYISKPFEMVIVRARVNNLLHQASLAKRLIRSNKSKDRILKVVAHDIRSPIATMTTLFGMLKEELGELDDPELESLFGYFNQATDQAEHLIDELLEAGRLDDDELTLELRPLNLADLLGKIKDLYQAEAKANQIELRLLIEKSVVIIDGDQDRLVRLLRNLVSNALKFTPEGGTVSLGLETQDKQVLLKVQDTGIGIPENLQSSIFDWFSKARRKGLRGEKTTGLGLYIARQIIQLHQGKIWFESVPEQGTTFFIQLPLVDPNI